MTIIEQQDPKHENRGLLIATIVLLNVGLVPLLMAYLGYARLVYATAFTPFLLKAAILTHLCFRLENDFSHSRPISIFLRLLKVGVLLATGLLGAAGGYAGKPEDAEKQSTLSKAAYAIFVVVLVALIGTFVALAGNLKSVARGRRYVRFAPFLYTVSHSPISPFPVPLSPIHRFPYSRLSLIYVLTIGLVGTVHSMGSRRGSSPVRTRCVRYHRGSGSVRDRDSDIELESALWLSHGVWVDGLVARVYCVGYLCLFEHLSFADCDGAGG